jgi:hypothetical protein
VAYPFDSRIYMLYSWAREETLNSFQYAKIVRTTICKPTISLIGVAGQATIAKEKKSPSEPI